jgi:hypothetical protein
MMTRFVKAVSHQRTSWQTQRSAVRGPLGSVMCIEQPTGNGVAILIGSGKVHGVACRKGPSLLVLRDRGLGAEQLGSSAEVLLDGSDALSSSPAPSTEALPRGL